MSKLLILLSLIFSVSTYASETYLFNMYFSMAYKGSTFKYHLNFYEGDKGLVVKSKINNQEQTHYVQTKGKQYIVARTPKELIDRPLFYMFRTSDNNYKIQYPVNMNDSKWESFIFTVKDGEATSRAVTFKNLKVGKTVFDSYWGMTVPVGVEKIDIN